MKLTVEENRETIKRFAHIEPAPRVGATRCGARCPGTARDCSRERGHRGPHVAHGAFRRVVAVWDGEGLPARSSRRHGKAAKARPATPAAEWDESAARSLVKSVWRQVVQATPPPDQAFLIIFFIGMVAAAIHWVVLLLG